MAVYKLKHITGKKLKTFLAAAECILPAAEGMPAGNTITTAGVTDWALHKLDAQLRKKFLLFLSVIEVLGVFFGGKTFSKNNLDARNKQLRWLENNRVQLLRMGFFGVKTYICMGYYTRDEIWKAMNYHGPVVERMYVDPIIRQMCKGEAEVVE